MLKKNPCPFCGSLNLGVGYYHPIDGPVYRYVHCNDCGCQGPSDGLIIKVKAKSDVEAYKLWNNRIDNSLF